jgi:tetratricopeptide (TPR) repeat protein
VTNRNATLADVEQLLRDGRVAPAREVLEAFVRQGEAQRNAVVELADRLEDPAAAGVCIETAADGWAESGDFVTAAAVLQEFSLRVPGQIQPLLRLVEICVEGQLDTAMHEAQAQLIDAYLDAGRPDEARVVAEDLAALQPAEPAHQERLRRARLMTSTPAAAGPSQEIDLTTFLGDLDEPRAEAVSDEVEPLELGRTYLEMGMPDEAVGPFESAAHAPETRFEASVALAGIYRQRGDLPLAIEWCERAAASIAPTVDASRSLLYELGDLLEASGEGARALAVFMEIDTGGAGYRDVAARLRRLARTDGGG